MRHIEGEIIVVDNASTDGSETFFQSRFREVQFIWNQKNVGFAVANNQAIQMAQGAYILILNPDTLIPEDCFEKCMDFIKTQNDNCALGIRMVDGSGKFLKESKRAFPSPIISFFKLSGLASLFPRSRMFSKYHLGYLNPTENHEVDVLAGAFIMVPRKIMDEVKGFDEIFFMYGEDVDFSYRIQKAGYKNFYFAESSIIHFKGESTKKGSLNYVKMFYSAMSLFVKKHYGSNRAGWFNFFIQTAIGVRAAMAAVSRFIKWVGLPVIDMILILFSLGVAKVWLEQLLNYPFAYSTQLLGSSFTVFTMLFMSASFFSGLYDNGYRQSKLNKSAIISTVVILVVYALLPKTLRVSKLLMCLGALLSFISLTMVRFFLLRWKIIEPSDKMENHQTIIAGNKSEFNKVVYLLKNSGRKKNIFQRIELQNKEGQLLHDSYAILSANLRLFPQKELIFCEGQLSFKQIIELLPNIRTGTDVRFFSRGSHTVIGSNNKNEPGEFFVQEEDYHLALPTYRRAKSVVDIGTALIFLITFPVHFITQKKPLTFFAETFKVLFFKKSWIGYSVSPPMLPIIKPGVITVTGLQKEKNFLPRASLASLDKMYAKEYQSANDVKILWAHYKNLS